MLCPLHHLRIPFHIFQACLFVFSLSSSPLPFPPCLKKWILLRMTWKKKSHVMLPFPCFFLLLSLRSGPLEWEKYPGDRMNACTRCYLSRAAWIIRFNKPWQQSVTFLFIYSLDYYSKNLPQLVSKDPAFYIIHLPLGLFNLLQEQVLSQNKSLLTFLGKPLVFFYNASDRRTKNILLLS